MTEQTQTPVIKTPIPKKEVDYAVFILGVGVCFMVLTKLHWAMPILGSIFILASGWLFYDRARQKYNKNR